MPDDTVTPSLTELEIRKGLGRAYLKNNRLEAALETYACILQDYPQDTETYVILGDCYLAEGNGQAAAQLYAQALRLAPGDVELTRRMKLAQAEGISGPEGAASPEPGFSELPGPVARLLQRLAGGPAPAGEPAGGIDEAELAQAAEILQAVINSPHPAEEVANRLQEIERALPGLLELNIRQARADGRPDLARALQNLLSEIQPQFGDAGQGQPSPVEKRPPSSLRLLFVAPDDDARLGEMPPRLALPAKALAALGCHTTLSSRLPAEALNEYDVVIAHRPHCDPRLMEGLAACAAARLPILLDLDLDYEQISLNHPHYPKRGLGTLARSKAYAAALLLADKIVVPSLPLAASLGAAGHTVQVIPDGWSRENELWGKPLPRRHTINLGWTGNPGQIEDLAMIRRIIVRVLREFPQTQLVISGDPQAYQLFDSLPESRRLFLPPVSDEDYPYLLGQVDILLAPLRNIPFNRATSDRWLVEAGARGIPWVASPVPSAVAWGAGGLLADSLEEWHSHLRQLVQDESLRAALGRTGRQQAEGREMGKLVNEWLDLIYSVDRL